MAKKAKGITLTEDADRTLKRGEKGRIDTLSVAKGAARERVGRTRHERREGNTPDT